MSWQPQPLPYIDDLETKTERFEKVFRIFNPLINEKNKLQIEIKNQLSDDMKIVPFVMPKERSEEFVDRLEQAVKESNYAEDLKKDLLKALGCMA